MFQKGDYIVYGSTGVCEVMDVTTVEMTGVEKDRLYYILRPYNDNGGRIFTPVDGKKTFMRKIISKEEAKQLIHDIPNIEELKAKNNKVREEEYKECLKSCECKEWIKIIKTAYLRKQRRQAEGKKLTVLDMKYWKQAEDNLYSEFSILFNIPKDKVEAYIAEQIHLLK